MTTIHFLLAWGFASSCFCGAIGYYLGHRGFVGVKSDIQDIKNDIAKVTALVKKKQNV